MIENIKPVFEKINSEQKKIRTEIREKTSSYLLTAFGLVAALSWNDAVKAFIEYILPQTKSAGSIALKFAYAIVLTVIVVIVTMYFLRMMGSNKEENKK